jgi:hypothetical protein
MPIAQGFLQPDRLAGLVEAWVGAGQKTPRSRAPSDPAQICYENRMAGRAESMPLKRDPRRMGGSMLFTERAPTGEVDGTHRVSFTPGVCRHDARARMVSRMALMPGRGWCQWCHAPAPTCDQHQARARSTIRPMRDRGRGCASITCFIPIGTDAAKKIGGRKSFRPQS